MQDSTKPHIDVSFLDRYFGSTMGKKVAHAIIYTTVSTSEYQEITKHLWTLNSRAGDRSLLNEEIFATLEKLQIIEHPKVLQIRLAISDCRLRLPTWGNGTICGFSLNNHKESWWNRTYKLILPSTCLRVVDQLQELYG